MTLAVARAVCRWHEHAAQHRQLAREGNRPYRRDGDRAAQARRDGRGGRRLPADHAARAAYAARTIDTYDDHRMAMCFSLAALGGVPVRINDPSACAKTFPDYFERARGDCGALRHEPRSRAGHRDRRPVGLGQGHGRRKGCRTRSGFTYLDSGALYRLVALAALERGIRLATNRGVAELARHLDVHFEGKSVCWTVKSCDRRASVRST